MSWQVGNESVKLEMAWDVTSGHHESHALARRPSLESEQQDSHTARNPAACSMLHHTPQGAAWAALAEMPAPLVPPVSTTSTHATVSPCIRRCMSLLSKLRPVQRLHMNRTTWPSSLSQTLWTMSEMHTLMQGMLVTDFMISFQYHCDCATTLDTTKNVTCLQTNEPKEMQGTRSMEQQITDAASTAKYLAQRSAGSCSPQS